MTDFLDSHIEANFEELSLQEQYAKTEELLNTDSYRQSSFTSPEEHAVEFYNPGVNTHLERLQWDRGWFSEDEDTSVLFSYPEYLPSDEAIRTISQHGPLVEIGSGDGYWAHVLEHAGINIRATDLYPPDFYLSKIDEEKEDIEHPRHNHVDDNGVYQLSQKPRSGVHSVWPTDDTALPPTPWVDMEICSHNIVQQTESTVLLCHPVAVSWTVDLLEYLSSGQKIVFVGEWFPGVDAVPEFFYKLDREFRLLDSFRVYNWQYTTASGSVFVKP